MQTTTTMSSAAGLSSSHNLNTSELPRRLVAFDFDYTVVGQNSDTVLRDLLPRNAITKDIDNLIESEGWIRYMSEVFRLLYEHGYKPEKIRSTVRGIPEVPGMVKCLKTLREINCDLIIISDANSVFINEWLRAHGLGNCIDSVCTNPARFEVSGMLTISPYHHQTDCRLSAANLCKGRILEHYIMERDLRDGIKYAQVVYVGDGNNDICPVLRLGQSDIACARSGFGMARNLERNKLKLKLNAKLIHWNNGFDLITQLQESFYSDMQSSS